MFGVQKSLIDTVHPVSWLTKKQHEVTQNFSRSQYNIENMPSDNFLNLNSPLVNPRLFFLEKVSPDFELCTRFSMINLAGFVLSVSSKSRPRMFLTSASPSCLLQQCLLLSRWSPFFQLFQLIQLFFITSFLNQKLIYFHSFLIKAFKVMMVPLITGVRTLHQV